MGLGRTTDRHPTGDPAMSDTDPTDDPTTDPRIAPEATPTVESAPVTWFASGSLSTSETDAATLSATEPVSPFVADPAASFAEPAAPFVAVDPGSVRSRSRGPR